MRVYNYGLQPLDLPLYLQFDSDFADIFEVRGLQRERRGHRLEAVAKDDGLVLGYVGLDGVTRRTRLQCSPAPAEVLGSELRLEIKLPPKEEVIFDLTVSCESAEQIASIEPIRHSSHSCSKFPEVAREPGLRDLYLQ